VSVVNAVLKAAVWALVLPIIALYCVSIDAMVLANVVAFLAFALAWTDVIAPEGSLV